MDEIRNNSFTIRVQQGKTYQNSLFTFLGLEKFLKNLRPVLHTPLNFITELFRSFILGKERI